MVLSLFVERSVDYSSGQDYYKYLGLVLIYLH